MLDAVQSKLDETEVDYEALSSCGVDHLKVGKLVIYFDGRFDKFVVDKPLGAHTYDKENVDSLIDHVSNGFFQM